MHEPSRSARRPTRRRLLAAVGTGTASVLAGCAGGSGGTEPGSDGASGATPEDDSGGSGTPTPSREPLAPPVAGNSDAAVTLEVYEDYACPHCARYNAEGFPELEEAYVSPGEIRYEHRDLPIPVADPGSFRAASAARAVQDAHGDGAFWPYADALFEHSDRIPTDEPDLFARLAEEQGHDPEAVRSAAVERTYRRTVERDRERAIALGAESTPAFALDGEIVASGFGSATVDTVRAAIDRALSETG
jgi:protein-disulfide isomerase